MISKRLSKQSEEPIYSSSTIPSRYPLFKARRTFSYPLESATPLSLIDKVETMIRARYGDSTTKRLPYNSSEFSSSKRLNIHLRTILFIEWRVDKQLKLKRGYRKCTLNQWPSSLWFVIVIDGFQWWWGRMINDNQVKGASLSFLRHKMALNIYFLNERAIIGL